MFITGGEMTPAAFCTWPEKLGAKEGEMGFNEKGQGFGVKMILGGHLHITCCNAEGGVLDGREAIYGRFGGVGEPHGCSIGE